MASEAFEEIVEDFEFLEDWEDRYRHIIELGKALPPLPDNLKNPMTKVEGCVSQVWLVPNVEGEGPGARFSFEGDSDAMIVRGIIALLKRLYDGLTVAEVLDVDARAELARLGLDRHLSAQRSNGLKAMIARIRTLAEKMADAG